MKKFFLAISLLLISALLLLPIGATETEVADVTTADTVIEDTALDTTAVITTLTETAEDTPADTPADTIADTPEDTNASGERVIPFDEFLLRMWDEYRDTIFAALSTVLSMIIALVFKNRFIPSVRALVGSQDRKLDAIAENNSKFISNTEKKLASFENYDTVMKQLVSALEAAELDREVLIEVIKLQASQVNKLIEFSNLPQARKDQIYEGYREQLAQIERLRGGGSDEA